MVKGIERSDTEAETNTEAETDAESTTDSRGYY
jgi:hypothetical protein